MMMITINWIDDSDGAAEIVGNGRRVVCRDLEELADFVFVFDDRLETTVAKRIGIVAFYFAIRDYGQGPPCTGLDRASRGLDSAYVVVQNQQLQIHINNGIEAARNSLFPIRDGTYEEIVSRAYHYMRAQLLE